LKSSRLRRVAPVVHSGSWIAKSARLGAGPGGWRRLRCRRSGKAPRQHAELRPMGIATMRYFKNRFLTSGSPAAR